MIFLNNHDKGSLTDVFLWKRSEKLTHLAITRGISAFVIGAHVYFYGGLFMKQRVRVAAIVRDGDNTLLLQRNKGRLEDTYAHFELPNGKIDFGEQPEESIARIVHNFTGTRADVVQLLDAITFTDLRDSSEISNLYIVFSIKLSQNQIRLNPDRHSSYGWLSNDDIRTVEIDDASKSILYILDNKGEAHEYTVSPNHESSDAIVYTDGGSRGNPGPSAIGYNILAPDGRLLARGGEFIGITNSRQAEYLALKNGIEQVLELGLRSANFNLDNLMVVNHMNGVYQVKNRDLWPIYDEIKSLLGKLDTYSFSHIKRDHNFEADAEVNRVLDQYQANKSAIL